MAEPTVSRTSESDQTDARRAIRFMLVKAAVFILIPLIAAVVAVALTLK